MFKKFISCLLMVISAHCVCAEVRNEKIETQEELLSEPNVIENIKQIVNHYAKLSADEKREYLAETGFTEEGINSIKLWTLVDLKTEGLQKLPLSNSTLSVPQGFALVTGKDAETLYSNPDESKNEFLEAYITNVSNLENAVVFQYFPDGYISIDDWNDLKSDELLKEITQDTENDNIERIKKGESPLQVQGWIEEPKLDKVHNTVYWALEASVEGDENIVNSVAFKLGREGYEKIVWIIPKSQYVSSGGSLDTMLQAHSFIPGYRYDDYQSGDKLAAYGIAGLVAATVGGKILKVGGFLIFFKKIGGFILVGLSALFYKFKHLFRRKENAL